MPLWRYFFFVCRYFEKIECKYFSFLCVLEKNQAPFLLFFLVSKILFCCKYSSGKRNVFRMFTIHFFILQRRAIFLYFFGSRFSILFHFSVRSKQFFFREKNFVFLILFKMCPIPAMLAFSLFLRIRFWNYIAAFLKKKLKLFCFLYYFFDLLQGESF